MDVKRVIGWALEIGIDAPDIKIENFTPDLNPRFKGENIEKATVDKLQHAFEVFIGCELESIKDLTSYAKILWVQSELTELRKDFEKELDEKLSKDSLKTVNGQSLIITNPNVTNLEIKTSAERYNFSEAASWVVNNKPRNSWSSILTYDNDDNQIFGEISFNNNSITAIFSRPVSGYIILIP